MNSESNYNNIFLIFTQCCISFWEKALHRKLHRLLQCKNHTSSEGDFATILDRFGDKTLISVFIEKREKMPYAMSISQENGYGFRGDILNK